MNEIENTQVDFLHVRYFVLLVGSLCVDILSSLYLSGLYINTFGFWRVYFFGSNNTWTYILLSTVTMALAQTINPVWLCSDGVFLQRKYRNWSLVLSGGLVVWAPYFMLNAMAEGFSISSKSIFFYTAPLLTCIFSIYFFPKILLQLKLDKSFIFDTSKKQSFALINKEECLIEKPLHDLVPSRSELAETLRLRARSLGRSNNLLLSIVIIVLFLSAWLMVNMGNITENDTKSLDSLRQIESILDGRMQELSKLREKAVELEIQMLKETQDGYVTSYSKSLSIRVGLISNEIVDKQRQVAYLEKVLDKKADSYAGSDSSVSSKEKANGILWATGATRFTVLIVSVYLVQILIGLYRHNAALQAFYLSIADSIEINKASLSDIKKSLGIIYPKMTLGRNESLPTERAIVKIMDLLKTYIDKDKVEKQQPLPEIKK